MAPLDFPSRPTVPAPVRTHGRGHAHTPSPAGASGQSGTLGALGAQQPQTQMQTQAQPHIHSRWGAEPLLAGQRLDLCVAEYGVATIVAVWGELSAQTSDELDRVVEESAAAGRVHVVLDLARLYDLDAAAIAELVRLRTMLAGLGGGLWLAAPRPWVSRLLDHMVAKRTFELCATPAAALARVLSADPLGVAEGGGAMRPGPLSGGPGEVVEPPPLTF